MVRKHEFKPGDRVKLNKLAVEQNKYSDSKETVAKIYGENRIGEVLRNETMVHENSNFRYSVRFEDIIITINENQMEHFQE